MPLTPFLSPLMGSPLKAFQVSFNQRPLGMHSSITSGLKARQVRQTMNCHPAAQVTFRRQAPPRHAAAGRYMGAMQGASS